MKSIHDFHTKKSKHEKISMVTCYDYTSAMILEKSNVDCVLVGDSGAMTMHGCKDTTGATLEMMRYHTLSVARGIKSKFIVADMSFMSYRISSAHTREAARDLIQAGAHAVKLEGVDGNLEEIRYLVASGIPVMGHIGLTPQHVHALGGYKVQGKSVDAQHKLVSQAKALEEAGCFSLVLECVPTSLARTITEEIAIPTIGIGAGNVTDGQVLVFQDLLGLQTEFKPKFVKYFLEGEKVFLNSINQYVQEVQVGAFPDDAHAF
jgi:3-methyl-2-oxobutanoate hydroxymethyltransferase